MQCNTIKYLSLIRHPSPTAYYYLTDLCIHRSEGLESELVAHGSCDCVSCDCVYVPCVLRNVPAGLLGVSRHHAQHRRGGGHDGGRGDAGRALQRGARAPLPVLFVCFFDAVCVYLNKPNRLPSS